MKAGEYTNEEVAVYKNILIATDGSELATNAAKHGVGLARCLNAKVTVVTVTLPYHWFPGMTPNMAGAYTQGQNRVAVTDLNAVSELAKSAGVEVEAVHAEGEHPYKVIIETAKAKHCDIIAMGSHGRGGIAAAILGSETNKVLTHSTIPVLVCD